MEAVFHAFNYSNGWQTVKLLTAKDGKPIELGDAVYGEDGIRYTITGIGDEYVWGRKDGHKGDKRLKPEWLTHTEPDSFERILEDAMDTMAIQYCSSRGLAVNPAGENRETKVADLVRRCEALAVQR